MSNKSSRVSRRPSGGNPPSRETGMDFWEAKTLEQLADEQGVRAIEHLEEVLGQGAELWRDDAELDSFLAVLRQQRRKGA